MCIAKLNLQGKAKSDLSESTHRKCALLKCQLGIKIVRPIKIFLYLLSYILIHALPAIVCMQDEMHLQIFIGHKKFSQAYQICYNLYLSINFSGIILSLISAD